MTPAPVFAGLVGQQHALELLTRAVVRPVHAYLLAGPPGCGVADAARGFAAALLCEEGGCGRCPACLRTLRSRHPDVVEVEPEGTEILVDQAAAVAETAFRSPVEGARKVIVIHEAERMNVAAANKLLKTLEEPPARTVFVLVAYAADELLDTVRSRCQGVPFSALTEAQVRDGLVAAGIDAEEAETAARLAGGRLDRARLLADEHRDLALVFSRAPSRLDGTAGSAAVAASDLLAAIDGAVAALEARHLSEQEELDAEIEQAGYDERSASRLRRVLTKRHERAQRRARTDALAAGLAVLEAVYRDSLVAEWVEPVSGGVVPTLSGDAALAAVDRVAAVRARVQDGIVLNWNLMVERLLLHLPADPDAVEVGEPSTATGTLARQSRASPA